MTIISPQLLAFEHCFAFEQATAQSRSVSWLVFPSRPLPPLAYSTLDLCPCDTVPNETKADPKFLHVTVSMLVVEEQHVFKLDPCLLVQLRHVCPLVARIDLMVVKEPKSRFEGRGRRFPRFGGYCQLLKEGLGKVWRVCSGCRRNQRSLGQAFECRYNIGNVAVESKSFAVSGCEGRGLSSQEMRP